MAPLVRRSWAPCGCTPILYQRTQSHQKVSVIAALCVAPNRHRLHLYFRLHPGENIKAPLVKDFLYNLLHQLHTPLILIWDRFLAHRAKTVRSLIRKTPCLYAFFLPPYAPELNPVENVWGYMKTNSMANLTPLDLNSLTQTTRTHGRSLQRKQNLLRSFLNHCPLSLRLT
jgi:transposase